MASTVCPIAKSADARALRRLVRRCGSSMTLLLAGFDCLCKTHPPDMFNYASAGIGTSQHLAGELFKMLTGGQIVHVQWSLYSGHGAL